MTAGAALVVYHDLTIQDSTFSNLNMTFGPALACVNDDSSHMEVSNCTFENIATPEEGPPEPILVLTRADLTMTGSTFSNCTALYAVLEIGNNPTLNDSWLANETVTIDNCTFVDNYGYQGPIYMLGKDLNPTQTLNLFNSNFTNNAGNLGGAVTAFAVGNMRVSGCLFEGNEAVTGMGAIYV